MASYLQPEYNVEFEYFTQAIQFHSRLIKIVFISYWKYSSRIEGSS